MKVVLPTVLSTISRCTCGWWIRSPNYWGRWWRGTQGWNATTHWCMLTLQSWLKVDIHPYSTLSPSNLRGFTLSPVHGCSANISQGLWVHVCSQAIGWLYYSTTSSWHTVLSLGTWTFSNNSSINLNVPACMLLWSGWVALVFERCLKTRTNICWVFFLVWCSSLWKPWDGHLEVLIHQILVILLFPLLWRIGPHRTMIAPLL